MQQPLKQFFLVFIICLSTFVSFSQRNKIDSLKNILNISKEDTSKVNVLNALAEQFMYSNTDTSFMLSTEAVTISNKLLSQSSNMGLQRIIQKGIAKSFQHIGSYHFLKDNYDQALEYYFKALKLEERYGNKSGIAINQSNIGLVYLNQDNLAKALDYYLKALKIDQEIGDKTETSIVLTNIGIVYRHQGDHTKALDYYLRALKIDEERGEKRAIAGTLGNLGVVYYSKGDYDKALNCYFKALKINEELGKKRRMADNLGNIGIVYKKQGDYSKALDYYSKALKIAKEINDKEGMSRHLGNIGSVYESQGDYFNAKDYYFKALRMTEEIGYKSGIATNLGNLGCIYRKEGKYKEGGEYLQKAVLLSKEIGYKDALKEWEQNLSQLDSAKGNYKSAYEHYKMYIIYRDSLFNEENTKAQTRLEMQFEFDKKQTSDSLKVVEERKLNAVKLKQEKTQRFYLYGGLILVVVFAGFMFNRFKVTQKQKKVIELKEQETQQQKHLVEEKNREITDSITYAKRLQEAILPPQEFINQNILHNFVLYNPKDIVAGDFYWAEKINNLFFIAAADSTGHGVPGAMVSVVCSNALDRTVKEFNLTEPGKILDKTRELVLDTFAKGNSEVKDGMDISLCSINTQTNEVYWSGANNPLWYIQNNELKEIKAHKQSIGKTDSPTPFPTHKIILQKGDTIYLITDGFADQFGGEKGKKYKYKQLADLLISTHNKSLVEQKQVLVESFKNWKGSLDQVDDVTIIGIQL